MTRVSCPLVARPGFSTDSGEEGRGVSGKGVAGVTAIDGRDGSGRTGSRRIPDEEVGLGADEPGTGGGGNGRRVLVVLFVRRTLSLVSGDGGV